MRLVAMRDEICRVTELSRVTGTRKTAELNSAARVVAMCNGSQHPGHADKTAGDRDWKWERWLGRKKAIIDE